MDTTEDKARKIVKAFLDDLYMRHGFERLLMSIDPLFKNRMIEEWVSVVRQEIEKP